MVSLVAYYISDSTVYLLLEQATGGKLYDYIRSYNRLSKTTINPSIQKIIPIKLPVKRLFKSNPIEIPETPISQLKVSEAKCNEDEDTKFSFYDLLQSYYGDAPIDVTSPQKLAATKIIECDTSFEEAPHFNMIANDLDVNNILNCSQKLLKSVSSTLKRVQTTEPSVLCTDIVSKSRNSVESLEQNIDENEEYLNILTPTCDELFETKQFIECDHYFDEYKLFDVTQLPRAIIKRWFREMIFAVKHLHANDILCYDLQPDNLLLGKNGEILLSYFYRREFERCNFGDDIHQTCYPSVYIAPERPLTFESDVWSIGVIFYELLTGKL